MEGRVLMGDGPPGEGGAPAGTEAAAPGVGLGRVGLSADALGGAVEQQPDPVLRESPIWTRAVIEEIETKAEIGRYRYAGGALHRPVPNFDGLTFIPCTLSRVPLEGYRERCETRTVLGTRAPRPVELDIPVTIVGMSFGALSRNAKAAFGKAATRVGTSTTTGDGGMHPMERENSKTLVYQVCPSHYGNNPEHMRLAEAVEIVVGQGAKPGTGGVLLGMKVSEEVARMRTLPLGVDQRSPVRHPDFIGADDLVIKIQEVREATEGQIPIYVKIGACRVRDDVKLAAKAGADVIVLDGMEGASAASPEILFDHTGIPTMAAVVEARRALEEIGLYGEVQLVVQGGIRGGVDAAKAIALGADAVGIGTAAMIALGCNRDVYPEDYERLGTRAGYCHHCHTGGCPVGITTQSEELIQRLDPEQGADRVANFLRSMVMEIQMLARACGKGDVHDLEPEDMRALDLETALITGISMVGMDGVPWPPWGPVGQVPASNGHR